MLKKESGSQPASEEKKDDKENFIRWVLRRSFHLLIVTTVM
jgi:hypothetical protein